jgi:CheY-like chemotaxis protein/HPt (histidine-containing phosphotransfer) domain-containing protein
VAESADAAVAALAAAAGRGAPFEAVVVQLAGAGGPGAAFLHRIRATESGAAARVVAVAPPGGGDLGVEWSALGVDQFVPDPPTSMRLAQALSGVDTVTAREDTAQPAGSDLLAGLHVLLVEDSELNQEVAAEMMGQSGAVVTITSNAAEALRQIEAHPKRFGVVLMDLQMPGMDGTTATRVIRETRPADDLPIVAFTAHALSEERDRALAAGMNDYLIKPVTRVQLIQALRKWTPPAGPDTPVSGEAEEQIALPASSEPLDLTTAIRNLGLPEPVILSLVGKFRVQYADTREQVTAALDAGDTGTAAGLVHTVRGSAGYLQASELYEAAGLLEEELQNGAPVSALPHLHRAFDAALAEALDAAAALEAGA